MDRLTFHEVYLVYHSLDGFEKEEVYIDTDNDTVPEELRCKRALLSDFYNDFTTRSIGFQSALVSKVLEVHDNGAEVVVFDGNREQWDLLKSVRKIELRSQYGAISNNIRDQIKKIKITLKVYLVNEL